MCARPLNSIRIQSHPQTGSSRRFDAEVGVEREDLGVRGGALSEENTVHNVDLRLRETLERIEEFLPVRVTHTLVLEQGVKVRCRLRAGEPDRTSSARRCTRQARLPAAGLGACLPGPPRKTPVPVRSAPHGRGAGSAARHWYQEGRLVAFARATSFQTSVRTSANGRSFLA